MCSGSWFEGDSLRILPYSTFGEDRVLKLLTILTTYFRGEAIAKNIENQYH
jgi:hypothetical protein